MSYSSLSRPLIACLVSWIVLAPAAWAQKDRDRTQVGHNITIGPNEQVSDATCFGCGVRVRGHVSSDVTTFGGSVVIEEGGQVDGDITTFGGGIRLGKDANVKGDVTVFGGRIQRDPEATIGGDVTNMGGPGWIALIVLAPFIFLGLVAALIVWVIRRLLRPSMPAAA
ncbi:MAG TPA: polymer-forming cytoskeletal protein [Candidatus Sulfotelmatobacter sp.]|jgi:hypothetical protein